jgi:hypothetical protein
MMLLKVGGFDGLALYLETFDMKTAHKCHQIQGGKKETFKSPFNAEAYFAQSDINELVYIAERAGLEGVQMFFQHGGVVKNGPAGCMGRSELQGMMEVFKGSDTDSLKALTLYLQRPGGSFDFDNEKEKAFFLDHSSKEIKGIYVGVYYHQNGKFPAVSLG